MRGIDVSILDRGTYLEAEEAAYPDGHQTRLCRAVWPDGIERDVWAGIPDTWFSIPAHGRLKGRYIAGYVSATEAAEPDASGRYQRWYTFRPYDRYYDRYPLRGTPRDEAAS